MYVGPCGGRRRAGSRPKRGVVVNRLRSSMIRRYDRMEASAGANEPNRSHAFGRQNRFIGSGMRNLARSNPSRLTKRTHGRRGSARLRGCGGARIVVRGERERLALHRDASRVAEPGALAVAVFLVHDLLDLAHRAVGADPAVVDVGEVRAAVGALL